LVVYGEFLYRPDISEVENAYCRLVDNSNKINWPYTLSAQGSHTAQIMAKLYRHGGEWKMHAIVKMVPSNY